MGWADDLYGILPIPLQDVATSLKGLELRLLRENRGEIARFFSFLQESERWTRDAFQDYQWSRLRKVLTNAFARVPHYRDLMREKGFSLEDFRDFEALWRIPILRKEDLRGHESEFIDQAALPVIGGRNFTSGTTGTPLRLFEHRLAFSKRWAFVVRLRAWAGLPNPFFPRRAHFTGRNIIPLHQDETIYWRRNLFQNSLLFSTAHISVESAIHYWRALHQFQPELIDGYPSSLLSLVRIWKEQKLPCPSPKAIIVTSETLFPSDRAELEEAFHAKVFNQFAASEPSCFWGDCEYGNLHVNPEYGITEILDENGQPAAPGIPGAVVVTSFLNPGMPLIRYRLGDMATLSPDQSCPCGRNMPIISFVEGRIEDFLYVPQRGFVMRVDPAFKGLSGIREAQVVQETLTGIRVLIVPDQEYSSETQRLLERGLRLKLGSEVRLAYDLVDAIPRGPNGKFKPVVSKVRDAYPKFFQATAHP